MTTEGITHESTSLESQRYQAMLTGDVEVLDQLLDEGLIYTHSSGTTDTKGAYLEGVKAKMLTYRAIQRSDEEIRVYGETAVVTGQAHLDVLIHGMPRRVNLRYLAVWVKGRKGWQTVVFQATPILP